MITELVGPDDARWRRMIETAAHDVYHLPGYGPLYERDPRARELALHVRGEEAELLLPLMIRPLPDLGVPSLAGWWDATSPYGYPGPIVRGAFRPQEVERLRGAFLDLLREHRILTCFVRGNPMLAEGELLLERFGTVAVHGDLAVVELEHSDKEIWEGYSQTNRRQIQRTRGRDYTIRYDEWSHLADFVTLYEETMRHVGATAFYCFDAGYFDRLRALLGDHLHLTSVVAPGGELACAGLTTSCGGITHAHLCASSGAHRHRSPSRLLYDSNWRRAREDGDRIVNFGGGFQGQEDTLLAFKKDFATGTRRFRTARAVCDQGLYAEACAVTGANGGDVTGYFPAYRRPA